MASFLVRRGVCPVLAKRLFTHLRNRPRRSGLRCFMLPSCREYDERSTRAAGTVYAAPVGGERRLVVVEKKETDDALRTWRSVPGHGFYSAITTVPSAGTFLRSTRRPDG